MLLDAKNGSAASGNLVSGEILSPFRQMARVMSELSAAAGLFNSFLPRDCSQKTRRLAEI